MALPTPTRDHVVVVVVTYNSAEVLPGLLDSLPTGMMDQNWELVVADNASTDNSVEIAAGFPDATVVSMGRNAGYAAGINAAVEAAKETGAVLVLNPDVRLGSGCVTELLRALEAPGTGIAVPRLLDGNGALIESIRREPTVLRTLADTVVGARRAGRSTIFGEVSTDPTEYQLEHVVDWAEGSTQLISRQCWQICGEWDESYFLYSEETEYNLRARDVGLSVVYVPTATATHLEGGSGTDPALWSLLVRNRIRLHRRRHGALAGVAFWAASLLREATRALMGRQIASAAVRVLVSPRRLREQPGPDLIRRDRARRGR